MADKGISVISHNGEDYNINDPNIAGEFYPNSNYAVGDHVTHEGKLYVFTAAHTGAWTGTDVTQVQIGAELHDYGAHAMVRYDVAQTLTDPQKVVAQNNIGAAAASAIGNVPTGETVEGQITDLKSAIIPYNAYDILAGAEISQTTISGITWTQNPDGSVTAQGTATAVTARALLQAVALPAYMPAGTTLYIKYAATKVLLDIRTYDADMTALQQAYFTTDDTFRISEDSAYITIRYVISKNATVDETVRAAVLTKPSNAAVPNVWANKVIAIFGDSRTWYDGKAYIATTKEEWRGKICKGFQYYMQQILGTKAIINEGVSGEKSIEICARIREYDFTDVDAVILGGGVNDFISGATVGKLKPIRSEFDTSTIAGAWQSAVEYIENNFPATQIFMTVPPIAWDADDNVYTWNYAFMKAQVADLYNIPWIDLYHTLGISELNRDYYYVDDLALTNRYLHFNDYGNKLIGNALAAFVTNANADAMNKLSEQAFLKTAAYDFNFADGDDLNMFTTAGTWKCTTSAIAASLLNNPFNGEIIRLFVTEVSSFPNTIAQVAINRYTGGLATRALVGSSWSDWSYMDNTHVTETAVIDSASDWSYPGIITRSGYDSESGIGTFACSEFLPVANGDYLHLVKCTSTRDNYLCIFYDASYNYLCGCTMPLSYATYADYFISVPIGASYMRALIRLTNADDARIYKVTDRKVEKPSDVGIKLLENFVSTTGNRMTAPFVNLRATHGPLFTLIDDDTRNVHQVTDFYKVCDDNGIYGTSACITKFPMADENLKNALLNSELRGHQTVFHCYDQYSNSHWSDETTYKDEILENVGTGIHHMIEMGFSDWKHWVTPAGVAGSLIKSLARRYGFSSITSITQNDFVGYDGYYTRWKIPRMELYPDDDGHAAGQTLAGIKEMIDKCVAQNGWLLVGVHTFQEVNYSSSFAGAKGWNNSDGQPNIYAVDVQTETDQMRFEERFQRMYEMIQYAKNAGMTGVTLGEGISYWDPIFRMYESF